MSRDSMTGDASRTVSGDLSEHLDERPLRWIVRFYVERLAFTSRGRFAFVVGMLYSIFDTVGRRPPASGPVGEVWGLNAEAVETVLSLLHGGLTVGIGILAGIVVLLLIDLYESEMGTLPEVRDEGR